MPTTNYRWIPLFLFYYLATFTIGSINSFLSEWSLYLFIVGLFVALPALSEDYITSLIVILLTGLLYDTQNNLSFGTTSLLMVILYIVLCIIKPHFKKNKSFTYHFFIQFANFSLILLLGLLQANELLWNIYYWTNLLLMWGVSSLFLFLIAPWFIQLQNTLLLLFNKLIQQHRDSQLT